MKIATFFNISTNFILKDKKNKMIKNNRLVSFSPGGYKNDLGGFYVKASESKKA
jgi:hypothetical protein